VSGACSPKISWKNNKKEKTGWFSDAFMENPMIWFIPFKING
jgi:hypothetical protein